MTEKNPTTIVAAAVLSLSITSSTPPNCRHIAVERVTAGTESILGSAFADQFVVRPAWRSLAASVFPGSRGLTAIEAEAYGAIIDDLFR